MGWLLQSIFCTESWRNKREGISHVCASDCGLYWSFGEGTFRESWARIRDSMKGVRQDPWAWISWLERIMQEFNASNQCWSQSVSFLGRISCLHRANRPATQWTLIMHWMSMHMCVCSCLTDLTKIDTRTCPIICLHLSSVQFSSVHLLSRVRFFATPWMAACQAYLSGSLLPELTQTPVHRGGDAIQPSHPLLCPSPPAPNPSQHQGLSQWVSSSHEVAKALEFQLQHQSFQRTPRTDLL